MLCYARRTHDRDAAKQTQDDAVKAVDVVKTKTREQVAGTAAGAAAVPDRDPEVPLTSATSETPYRLDAHGGLVLDSLSEAALRMLCDVEDE